MSDRVRVDWPDWGGETRRERCRAHVQVLRMLRQQIIRVVAVTSVDGIDSEWAGTETERVHQASCIMHHEQQTRHVRTGMVDYRRSHKYGRGCHEPRRPTRTVM